MLSSLILSSMRLSLSSTSCSILTRLIAGACEGLLERLSDKFSGPASSPTLLGESLLLYPSGGEPALLRSREELTLSPDLLRGLACFLRGQLPDPGTGLARPLSW